MALFRCSCGTNIIVPDAAPSEAITCPECGTVHNDSSVTLPPGWEANEDPEAVPRDVVIMLTSENKLLQRTHPSSLSHYLQVVEAAVRDKLGELNCDVQLSMALFPDEQGLLLEVDLWPSHLADKLTPAIDSVVRSVTMPTVNGGPVAFSVRLKHGSGASSPPLFSDPAERLVANYDSSVNDLDASLWDAVKGSPVSEPRKRWWTWVWELLFGATIEHRQVEQLESQSSLTENEPNSAKLVEILPSESALTLDELSARIERFPKHVRSYRIRAERFFDQADYASAIEDLNKIVELRPRDPLMLTVRAEAHFWAGSSQLALADLNKAIQINPTNSLARRTRGQLFAELNAWEPAAEDFSVAIHNDGLDPDLFVSRGWANFCLKKITEAVADFNEAIRLDPHLEKAYWMRALIYSQDHDELEASLEHALEDFDEVVRLNGDSALFYAQRADVLFRLGRVDEAHDDCEEAIGRDDECALAFAVRGSIAEQNEDYQNAVQDLSQAQELGLKSSQLFVTRAMAHVNLGNFDLAKLDLDEAISINDNDAMAFDSRGLVHIEEDELDLASEDFEEAIRLAPSWSLPYAHRANLHRLRGNKQAALEDYNRAIELEPDVAFFYFNRGVLFQVLGKLQLAVEDFGQALKISPEITEIYYHRALVWIAKEDFDLALKDLNELLRADPDSAQAYLERAYVYLRLEQYELSLADHNRLLDKWPDEPRHLIARSCYWLAVGDLERSDEDYQRALELEPEASEEFELQTALLQLEVYLRNSEYDQAIRLVNRMLDNEEFPFEIYAARGLAFWARGDFVDAIEDFSKEVELEVADSVALTRRGGAYAELGEYSLALADLDAANAQEADDEQHYLYSEILCHRGLAYLGLDRMQEAKDALDQSLRLRADSAHTHYNLGLWHHQQGNIESAIESFRSALLASKPGLPPRKRVKAQAFVDSNLDQDESETRD